MVTLADVRNKLDDQAIKAVFIRHPRMPDGFVIGTVYSDDPEVAQRLRDKIDSWGGSWTVVVGDELPTWMGWPYHDDTMFTNFQAGYIADCHVYVSREDFAFGDDIPVLIVNDPNYELKPVS